jgi:mRNA interferase MazF
MPSYKQGDIVMTNFPYTDLSQTKKRPAVVLSTKGQYILAQITSQFGLDEYTLPIRDADLQQPLPKQSFVKTNMIFTLDDSLIIEKKNSFKANALEVVLDSIKAIFDIE